jgi:hypothetical protein
VTHRVAMVTAARHAEVNQESFHMSPDDSPER